MSLGRVYMYMYMCVCIWERVYMYIDVYLQHITGGVEKVYMYTCIYVYVYMNMFI